MATFDDEIDLPIQLFILWLADSCRLVTRDSQPSGDGLGATSLRTRPLRAASHFRVSSWCLMDGNDNGPARNSSRFRAPRRAGFALAVVA